MMNRKAGQGANYCIVLETCIMFGHLSRRIDRRSSLPSK